MGDTTITVTIGGSGGLGDELALAARMRVKHSQGACLPCRMNNNPRNIPCEECTGNIAGRVRRGGDADDPDADDAKALAIGNLCNCSVYIAEEKAKDDL